MVFCVFVYFCGDQHTHLLMTSFFGKLKGLLLSYPDKEYIDWQMSGLKQSVKENHIAPLLIQNLLYRSDPGVTSERCCGEELVVSLSTFGQRIHGVALTVESIMEQTVRPNRIVLYLGHEFEGPGRIPGSLRLLERRGLEIRFVRDIGPYTKLLPALRDFPGATVITVDDDILYDFDFVSTLVNGHLVCPGAVVAPRCRVMEVAADGGLRLPFVDWGLAENGCEPSMWLQPEGVRGVLYPPESLDGRVFDEEVFMALCPTTDDFWFKAMSLLRGTPVMKCYGGGNRASLVNSRSDVSRTLHEVNSGSDGYDCQWRALFKYFDLGRFLG